MGYYTKTRIILMLVFLQQLIKATSSCTVLIAEDYKVNIISYPGDGSSNYNKNLDICWKITSDTPLLFSLSSDVGAGDFIRVFDGGDMETMTKENKQSNTETKLISPPVQLRFTSDGTLDVAKDKGFIFRYITGGSTVSGCGASLTATATTNYMTSPNFPSNYNKNEICEWKIKSAVNTTINLSLKFMDVEKHGACQYDYVQVIDPAGNNSSKMCEEYVWSPTFTFTSTENNVQIYFKSDEFSPKTGFVFAFTSSEKELGSNCTSAVECGVSNAVCSSNTCSCSTDYFDDNGALTPGGKCILKKELGSSCSKDDECENIYAVCLSSKCSCSTDYFDDNGALIPGGKCISKACLLVLLAIIFIIPELIFTTVIKVLMMKKRTDAVFGLWWIFIITLPIIGIVISLVVTFVTCTESKGHEAAYGILIGMVCSAPPLVIQILLLCKCCKINAKGCPKTSDEITTDVNKTAIEEKLTTEESTTRERAERGQESSGTSRREMPSLLETQRPLPPINN